MKVSNLFLTGIVLMLTTFNTAYAESKDEGDTVYLKLDLGSSTFPSYSAPAGATLSSESKVGDLVSFTAGLEVSSILAFEISHNRFGDQQATISAPVASKFKNEISSNALSIIPTLPIGEKISFFVELGQHAWEAESETAGIDNSTDGSDLFYGFGFNYSLKENVRTGIQFSRYNLDSENLKTMQVAFGYLF